MEDETFCFGSYPSKPMSHNETCIDFEEVDEDDNSKTAYSCPFCAEDFDLLGLWCHIDSEHPVEANSGICPVCASWGGMNMVGHITAQHGNIFNSQHKLRHCKLEFYPNHLLGRRNIQDGVGHWQSFSTWSYPVISTSKTASDPLLSFLSSAATADECENVQPHSSSEKKIEETHSDDETLIGREDQPSSSYDKDPIERAWRCAFVQGLLLTTLDSDF